MREDGDMLVELCIIVVEKLQELNAKGLLSDTDYKEHIESKIKFLQNYGYNISQWDETKP